MPAKPEVQRRLGKAVKDIRAAKAITQEELSQRTGLHTTYISDIERGARNPSFEVLVRLAAGLDVTMAELGAAYDRRVRRGELRPASAP
jgi:transcriptional regulator with XRE-family HTH domain